MLRYGLLSALVFLTGGLVMVAAIVMRPRARKDLERRLSAVSGAAPAKVKDADAGTRVKVRDTKLDVQMRRLFAARCEYTWGMQSGAVKLLLAAGFAGIAIWVFTSRFIGASWWVVVPATLAAAFLLPRALLRREQARAEAGFMDLFPDAMDTIVRMLRAGLPMTAAVRVVGTEAAAPVSTVFNMISDQMKIGIPIEAALDASSQQIGLTDFRFFAVAILLQYSTGGNIASTLEVLSTIIRKRRAMHMKAKSATAEIRLSAYVLGALPLMTVGALLVIQPGYLTPLFTDPRGHNILGIAGAGLLLTFISMRHMMRSVSKS